MHISKSPHVFPLSFTFKVQTDEYRSLPIPGSSAKIGDCFVRAIELPDELDVFLKVNPRVPTKNKKGVLLGPVVRGILDTLREYPEDMALKNQGIYILADEVQFRKESGGIGYLTIRLDDPDRHGILNGGHTFAAIRHAIDTADEIEKENIDRAFVRLHILQGIEKDKVPEIAEGLNRSKQVDDPSLDNLRGHFDRVKDVMRGKPGEDQIAYQQGAPGDLYIAEVLVYLEMFNRERFEEKRHPSSFFARTKSALEFFEIDIKKNPSPMNLLIPQLPDILQLADKIRFGTPETAKQAGFEFGRMKDKPKAKKTAKLPAPESLHFIGKQTRYRVPRGWLYPMLASFRANVDWDLSRGVFKWSIPLDELVEAVLPDLVRVCIMEHRDNSLKPDLVGKRESAYAQCYKEVLLHLLRKR